MLCDKKQLMENPYSVITEKYIRNFVFLFATAVTACIKNHNLTQYVSTFGTTLMKMYFVFASAHILSPNRISI